MYALTSDYNLTANDTMPFVYIYSSTTSNRSSSLVLIFILSTLCFFGVIFMIFGPMMRSEAIKRVDNYIFGRTPEQRHQVIDSLEQSSD
ncbi:unnamed protein product [Rotaria magnacalcarata]|uniref:Uncharacterized protein n=1 Tax=Rotaria magnacalcarata TaxID=392030 RepID=A0A820NGZ5_9BILA|nr:unnamed protein product [Rotaria magnacalcarata]CAF4322521.1 unnamed protein product [Rotaria magnacalcarata]CAF4388616.1 unnamed protein product [Rotaria magnacalcarata]CAF4835182.1 unnamed protein product [Rotaria magnacalcarata]CAF4838411.1 unnamed protein product [Rotaria magnacalcarata]